MKLYNVLKQMMLPAEAVGDIKSVSVDENWIGMMDRINFHGVTYDGRKFELTLEIMNKKEDEADGN